MESSGAVFVRGIPVNGVVVAAFGTEVALRRELDDQGRALDAGLDQAGPCSYEENSG